MLPEPAIGFPPFWLLVPWTAVLCLWLVQRAAARDGVERWRVVALQLAWSLAALAGAKAFSILETGRVFEADGALNRGWRYSGGVLGMALGVSALRPFLLPSVALARYADWLAPVFAFGHAVMRGSCFLNGCCTGAVCHSAWCLTFPPGSTVVAEQFAAGLLASPYQASLPVLPLHLLFLAMALGVGLFLLAFDPYRRFDGQTFLLFLVLHEGGKLGLEFLRVPEVPALEAAAAVPAAVGLIALLAMRGRRRRAIPR
jgi:prolipoprotein diacylglyceryltransferase